MGVQLDQHVMGRATPPEEFEVEKCAVRRFAASRRQQAKQRCM